MDGRFDTLIIRTRFSLGCQGCICDVIFLLSLSILSFTLAIIDNSRWRWLWKCLAKGLKYSKSYRNFTLIVSDNFAYRMTFFLWWYDFINANIDMYFVSLFVNNTMKSSVLAATLIYLPDSMTLSHRDWVIMQITVCIIGKNNMRNNI
jgi:hypothetical protein